MNWFKTFKYKDFEYHSSKVLVLITVLLIGSLGVYALSLNDFSGKDYYYTRCINPEGGFCINPFYKSNLCDENIINKNDVLCTQEKLLPNTSLGIDAPWIVKNFNYVGSGMIIGFIVLNTLLFNRHIFTNLRIENDE